MSSFFGCLYAGVIAVPTYPPVEKKLIDKLQVIIQNATPKVILSNKYVEPENIAFLQYTSGSVGNPKGVMITHKNILTNLTIIDNSVENADDQIGVVWLPLIMTWV